MNKNIKQPLDWANIRFGYTKCPFRFQAHYKDGKWQAGKLIEGEEYLTLHESSTALHYGQQCFEGLKANTAKDNRILLFRPELNWERMKNTAERLVMQPPSKDMFIDAIYKTVVANKEYVPPFGYGASLYIRPLLIGVGDNLGINTAKEFIFRVFVSPVGSYYAGGEIKPITLALSTVDRAAPRGIGQFKAGSNYIAALKELYRIRQNKVNDMLFLDPLEKKFIDEAGAANVIIYFKDNTLATPKADTILPSITRRSAMVVAEEILKIKTECRPIDFFSEVNNIEEMANCGTAALVAPVGKIIDEKNNKTYRFYDQGNSVGPVMKKIHETLIGIQLGIIEDKFNWNFEVKI